MNVRYVVELTEEERAELRAFVSGGSKQVRKVKRAQILLASDRRSVTHRDRVLGATARSRSLDDGTARQRDGALDGTALVVA